MERLDTFMARANAAYYATHDPFRDFTTSPEITQVFGELLGAWAAVIWQQIGRPASLVFAECGPGRGTLMQDARRATARIAPGFHAAADVHLVETSARLRAEQARRITRATWHDDVATLPPGPLILFANEFLDALPIRQFIRRGPDWRERWVHDAHFHEQPNPGPAPWPDGAEADIRELNQPAQAWTHQVATRIASQGGAALILDYGPARSAPGETLQALQNGRFANPLLHPGEADLTAHVDFQPLTAIATACGADTHGPVQQGPFLARLGLFQRTGVLARGQSAARATALIHAAQRLAEPDRMGGLFKACAVCQPGLPTPPGFEP